jgi:hypothetical protein
LAVVMSAAPVVLIGVIAVAVPQWLQRHDPSS